MAKTGSIKITMKSQDIVNMTTTFNVTASITTSGESYRGDHNRFVLYLNQNQECVLPSWFGNLVGWTLVKDSGGNPLYAYYSVGVPQNTTKPLCNFDVTMKHYSTGTSGTITASFDYADGWCTASTSTTFPSIQPKSTLSAPSGTLGEELTISVKKNNTRFTHTITYTLGNRVETLCQKASDTTIKWTPPIDLASQFPNSPSGVGRISIETFDGNTSLGSNAYNLTLSVPKTMIPIIDDVYITDSKGFASALGGYVKGKSGVHVNITARGVYGSTITDYETVFQGITYPGQYVYTNTIKNDPSGIYTISCRVKDSRGQYSETHIFEIPVLEYYPPAIDLLKVSRCDATNGTFTRYNPQGQNFAIEYACRFADLNGEPVDYIIEYKKTTETTYQRKYVAQTLNKGGTIVISADPYSTYNIRFTISDYFEGATKETIGYSARRVFDIWKSKFSIAFGKVCELENAFEVLFETIKLKGKTKVTIEGGNIDLIPSDTGKLLYKGTDFATHSDFFGQKLLWNGNLKMESGDLITLPKKISETRNGIVLVFGRDTAYNLMSFFVPKAGITANPSVTWVFPMCTSKFDYIGAKTIYIDSVGLRGHTDNTATAKNSISGITYHNESFYLKYVYEV